MIYDDIWERANVESIGDFLLTGELPPKQEKEKMEDRHKQFKKDFYEGLRSLRDSTISFDWDSCNEEEKEMKSEKFWENAAIACMELHDLAFSMGLQVGLSLRLEPLNIQDK